MTSQQAILLQFIDGYMTQHHGRAPSFDEMKDALGLRAKSGVHRVLSGLAERGYIVRRRHSARNIRVLRPPGGPTTADALHAMVAKLCREEGPDVAFAALVDLARDISPLLQPKADAGDAGLRDSEAGAIT